MEQVKTPMLTGRKKKSPQKFPGSGSLGAQVKLYFSNNTVNGVFYKTLSHLILMMASKDGLY